MACEIATQAGMYICYDIQFLNEIDFKFTFFYTLRGVIQIDGNPNRIIQN